MGPAIRGLFSEWKFIARLCLKKRTVATPGDDNQPADSAEEPIKDMNAEVVLRRISVQGGCGLGSLRTTLSAF
jgi:hypothetical protein